MPEENRNLPVVVKMGRPPGWGFYCEEIVSEIIERMCEGETLRMICRTDYDGRPREPGTFPNYATIYNWADPNFHGHHSDFVTRFARAQQIRERVLIDLTVDIANQPQEGIEETLDIHPKFGVTMKRVRKDMLGHRKLQIDTIHQYLSKTNPRVWAERLQEPASKSGDDTQVDRLIIEGGLPDNEPPPPRPPTDEPPQGAPQEEQ